MLDFSIRKPWRPEWNVVPSHWVAVDRFAMQKEFLHARAGSKDREGLAARVFATVRPAWKFSFPASPSLYPRPRIQSLRSYRRLADGVERGSNSLNWIGRFFPSIRPGNGICGGSGFIPIKQDSRPRCFPGEYRIARCFPPPSFIMSMTWDFLQYLREQFNSQDAIGPNSNSSAIPPSPIAKATGPTFVKRANSLA